MRNDVTYAVRVKGPSGSSLGSVSKLVGAICTSSPEWTGSGFNFLIRFGSMDEARGALVRAERILRGLGELGRCDGTSDNYTKLTFDSVTAQVEEMSAA